MLRTKVKASSVNNLTDARYFAARGVEWLGFQLETGNSNSISIAAAKAIVEWVDGVSIVAEFEFTPVEQIIQYNELLKPNALQVGMFTPIDVVQQLRDSKVIKEVVIGRDQNVGEVLGHLNLYTSDCEFFLLDFVKSGLSWEEIRSGKPISSSDLRDIARQYRILLNVDLTPDILMEILDKVNPYGFCLSGGDESKIGFKSYDELDQLFDLLEI